MIDTEVQQFPAQLPRLSVTHRLGRALSFRNISALYIFAVTFVIFALWVPDTFLTSTTWKSLLDSQAVTTILAIGLTIALSAGAFDLAVGAELGFGSVFIAWLLVQEGVPAVPAIAITLLAGAAIGAISGWLIVKVRIDSFIATLGVSSILLAVIDWVSNSQQIIGVNQSVQNIATTQVLGQSLPVYLMLIIAIAAWYVLERTPLGRRIYATGGNSEAARLAGVRVSLVLAGTLVACGMIAAFAGILVTGQLATGDPTIGPAYLLPAFSAAFLGSTQFRGGRFNVWGTVVAVYVLATGVKGLQLAGAPIWIPALFNGVALILAVGLAASQRTSQRTRALRRLLRLDSRHPDRAAVTPQR
jgi:ribose transport system permease protein